LVSRSTQIHMSHVAFFATFQSFNFARYWFLLPVQLADEASDGIGLGPYKSVMDKGRFGITYLASKPCLSFMRAIVCSNVDRGSR
jgi:hypothetical protein